MLLENSGHWGNIVESANVIVNEGFIERRANSNAWGINYAFIKYLNLIIVEATVFEIYIY